ncbi:MAG: PAS domain S-box protein [bacterium]|nr:PAS domain S-box protein [bacterium]
MSTVLSRERIESARRRVEDLIQTATRDPKLAEGLLGEALASLQQAVDELRAAEADLGPSETRDKPAATTHRVLGHRPGDHICCIYETEEERRAVLTRFLGQGLEGGEKVVFIADTHSAETVLDDVRDEGLSVEPYVETGQLAIATCDDTYTRDGVFDPDRMIEFLRSETERAIADGYHALRVASEMAWALRGLPGTDRLAEYETKLSEFLPGSRCLAICHYDQRRFEPEVLLDVLHAHPVTIVGTESHGGFYYVPRAEARGRWLPAALLEQTLKRLAEHKRAAKAARESEGRYRAIAEDTPVLLCRFLPGGIVTYVNEAYCQYFEKARDELVGRTFLSLIPEAERETIMADITALTVDSPAHSHEHQVVTPGGEVHWQRWTNRVLFDARGRPVEYQAVGEDITDRKLAEEELRRFAHIVSSSSDMLALLDEDFVHLATNEAYLEAFGKTCAELIGHSVAEIFDQEFFETTIRPNAELCLSGTEVRYQEWFEFPACGRRYMDITYSPYVDADEEIRGFVVCGRDITERRNSEDTLRRSQSFLQTVIDAMPDSTLVVNLDYRVVLANRAAQQMTGMEGPVAGCMECYQVHHGRNQPCADAGEVCPLERVAATKAPVVVEHIHHGPDGEERFVEVTASPILDDAGHVAQVIETCRDITERKRGEVERERLLHDMGERVKELRCMYRVSESIRTRTSLDEILQDAAEFIPPGWQYPDVTRGRVLFDGKEYVSEPFEETEWKQSSDIVVDGELRGSIEVYRLEARPEQDEGPFMLEERSLIDGLSRSLAGAIARARAEEALQESTKRLQLAMEAGRAGTWTWDIAAGDVHWDDRMQEIFGLEPGTFSGTFEGWKERVHPEDLPTAEAATLEALERNRRYECEYRVRGRESVWNTVNAQAVLICDQDGRPLRMVGLCTDITERKRAEEELRRSERHFRAIFDQTFQFIGLLTPDGVLIEANRTALEFTGVSESEVLGKPFWETPWWTHDPEQQGRLREAVRRGAETGEFTRFEASHPAPDGSIRYVDFSLKPVRDDTGRVALLIAEGRDITERKLAEEERERLMSAIEQAAEMVLITDVEGAIQYVNPAFEHITGYTRDEVTGKNPRILKSGKQNGTFYRTMWDTLARGETWNGRLVNKKKSGTHYTEEATISPVLDASGKTTSYVAVKRDITEEIRIEEQLRQAQKLEAVGQLAGGVAHDFSNLITAIMGYAELAEQAIAEHASAGQAIEGIQEAARQAESITRSLLTFSAKTPPQKERVNLRRLLQKSVLLLRHTIPTSISITTDLAGEPPIWLHADGTQLQQIILNLAVNARDAMPDGGALHISAAEVFGRPAPGGNLDVPGLSGNRVARLVVSDTGTGMAAETKNRVFEPFFTTKAREQGTGLGLAIVHGIVAEHGGRVEIDSAPGEGTTFRIMLPVVETEDVGSVEEPARAKRRSQGELVLLAEDNRHVRSIITASLFARGYDVVAADDGVTLMAHWQEHRSRVQMLVIDIDLPGQSGLDCLGEIRDTGSRIPAIVITGSGDVGVDEQDTLLIRKPFQVSELVELVGRLLGREHEQVGKV